MMKRIGQFLAWGFAAAAILYTAVGAEHAVMFQSPTAAMGVGLIGFGLCLEARRRLAAKPAEG